MLDSIIKDVYKVKTKSYFIFKINGRTGPRIIKLKALN